MLQSKWRHFIIGIGADDEPEVTIVFLRPTIMGMSADIPEVTNVAGPTIVRMDADMERKWRSCLLRSSIITYPESLSCRNFGRRLEAV